MKKFLTAFNRPKTQGVLFAHPSRTRLEDADSCDINKIMERFNRTGQLTHVQKLPAQYGDAIPYDFQTAQNLIKEAKDQFMSLPSKVRKHFENDPQVFLAKLQEFEATGQSELEQEFKSLGILVDRPKETISILEEIALNTRISKESAESTEQK